MRQEFGGNWTQKKLEVLEKYLKAYMTIMRGNKNAESFRVTYLDGFAGSGVRYVASDGALENEAASWWEDFGEAEVQDFYKGSPRVALDIEKKFDRYIFVEKNPQWVAGLQKMKQDYPPDLDIQIEQADCNEFIRKWCDAMQWKDRALVFLDPYGMQIEWSTVERLAETRRSEKTGKVDVWMLVPMGAAIMRMLTHHGEPPPHWRETLNKFFGTEKWLTEFYRDFSDQTLFGEEEKVIRKATFREITNFFVSRLREVFPGVLDEPAVFRNSKNVPLYLLCFATSNPNPSVINAALRIARHITKGFK